MNEMEFKRNSIRHHKIHLTRIFVQLQGNFFMSSRVHNLYFFLLLQHYKSNAKYVDIPYF